MKFGILFFSLLGTVAAVQYSCYVRTYFAKLCYQFDFQGSCQPWQLENCQPIRVTTQEYHCPRYFCVSSFQLKRHLQLTNASIGFNALPWT